MTVQQSFLFDVPREGGRRNLVLEAGAGTGKTTAIVREVIQLLLDRPDLVPERLVLITFTEKAAGEIADRIREGLTDLFFSFESERAAWPSTAAEPIILVPNEKREAYRRACEVHLQRIDRLRSQTIHSFCQSILRLHPLEAGLDPDFAIIEGFEQRRIYDEIYDDWFSLETTEPLPDAREQWSLVFSHFGYLDRIRSSINLLVSKRSSVRNEAATLGDLSDIEPAIVSAVATIRRATLADVFQVAADAPSHVIESLRTREPPDRGSLEAWIHYLDPIDAALGQTKLPQIRAGYLRDAIKILRGDSASGERSIPSLLRQHRVSVALRDLAIRYIAHLDLEKRRRGIVDFDDLLIRTNRLLDEPNIAGQLRERFDHLFVDEFQDTDRVQAEIITKLGSDESGRLVAGKTVIVGDPKQSIYSFRSADPECYAETVARYLAEGAKRDLLSRQFRSDPPLVDGLNAIFEKLFPLSKATRIESHTPVAVFRPHYEPLEAAKSASEQTLDSRFTFLAADEDDSRSLQEREARAIARCILSRDPERSNLGRFAILFRRFSKLESYLEVFDACALPVVLPPGRELLSRRPVVELLSVLRAISYSFDRGAQISAARSPYFAASDVEIVENVLGLETGNTVAMMHERLEHFRKDAKHLSVTQIIDRLFDETDIETYYAMLREGESARVFLQRFRDLGIEFDETTGGSLRQFVDEMYKRKGESDDTEPASIDEDANAIKILTIHGAKGLEFGTVILPDLAFGAGSSDIFRIFSVDHESEESHEATSLVFTGSLRSLSAFRTANGMLLSEVDKAREKAETDRLLYVAITRARSDVVFVHHAKMNQQGFWASLSDMFALKDLATETLWPANAGREIVTQTISGQPLSIAIERQTTELPDTAGSRFIGKALELATSEPIGFNRQAASVDRLEPREALIRRAAAQHRTEGIFLHRILERWDHEPASLEPLIEAVAEEQQLDDAALARTRSRLSAIFRSATFTRIRQATTLGRELPIYSLEEQGTVEARLDRLLIEPSGFLIVDYKTGRAYPSRLEHDQEQIQRYCTAVARMTGGTCRGLLWYIDVDGDDVVEVG